MYILYLDESGNPDDPSVRHFVLGGAARETRLLQAADTIAHGAFLLYERRNASILTPLLRRFDQRDGVLHGLVHVTADRDACECPRCSSNRTPNDFGPWVAPPPASPNP